LTWQNTGFKRLQSLVRPRQLAVLEACLIGLVSGFAAVLLKQGASWLGLLRFNWSSQAPAWVVLPMVGAIGGWLSGWLIQRFAPDATGSGIPQVKMALVDLPTQLDGRMALIKLGSTLLSLGSGLSLGRQGPTVQIGAAIAAQLSQWFPTSPEHRRQLIAAGAAAGLAAGFNAPIAGVLFVVEELLQDVSGLTLGTAILASFIGAVVSRLLGGNVMLLDLMDILPRFELSHIPLFLLVGAIAGILGDGFIRGLLLSQRWQNRLKLSLAGRVGAIGLVSGLIVAVLPKVLYDSATLQENWQHTDLGWFTLALIFLVKFGLTTLAFGSGAPGGLFAPSLVLGSTLGYLIANGIEIIQTGLNIHLIQTGPSFAITLALGGMAAFFSAVTRGPITAIIIVFEMTGNFELILPLMISTVTAYWVGESIASGSIYKYVLANKGIRLNQTITAESKLANLKAADLMYRSVETLPSELSIEEATQAFALSHHRGFPVVKNGELIGIITQSDLMQASLTTLTIDDLMTRHPVSVKPHDPLSQVLYLLSRYKISRLPVVDRQKLVGIITRTDIIRAESEQLTGAREQAIAQQDPSYVVYQTRDPEIGLGRLLVPIANPLTAPALLKIACAIARDRHYELECVQVIVIPRHQSPAETPVSTIGPRQLMTTVTQIAQAEDIAIHTQIRVAHDVAGAILETIAERHIDLLVMGWFGGFGAVVDTLMRQADCRVALVKLAETKLATPAFDRWLFPVSSGANSRYALKLLPTLLSLSDRPDVFLCTTTNEDTSEERDLDRTTKILKQRITAPITTIVMPHQNESIADTIVGLSIEHDCDVIILGATRAGLLQQVIQGNIPATIARQSPCTVILVRTGLN
jgi:chloride channel protein, CIC family